jgi:hypothetical protein
MYVVLMVKRGPCLFEILTVLLVDDVIMCMLVRWALCAWITGRWVRWKSVGGCSDTGDRDSTTRDGSKARLSRV